MFGKIRKVISNIEKIKPDAITKTIISKREVKNLVLQLNRVEQLFRKGIGTDGEIFGTYSFRTEEKNEARSFNYGGFNQIKEEGKPIILYDSGEFYKSFRVQVYNDGFSVLANDEKDGGKLLTEIYGNEILGLTKTSKSEVSKFVKPIFEKEVRKQIFAK